MQTFRNILVAVVGLTPQIITETLYYLTQVEHPPVVLSGIHVLTTQPGQARLVAQLLAPEGGHFYRFCAEYGLDPASIVFQIHVLSDQAQMPLHDIRTAADSAAAADQIAALVQQLSSDPTTRLYASLAGGRKTQSVLLGFAMQLYGRPQDRLLHVLVDEAFQNHAAFFYPTRNSQPFTTADGRCLDAQAARINLVDMPFLRLRDKLLSASSSAEPGFAPAIIQAQQAFDALLDLPALRLSPATRSLNIHPTSIVLTPLQFALYAQLARIRLQQDQQHSGDGFVTLDDLEARQEELVQCYSSLYGVGAERVASLRRQWARGWPRDSMRSHFASINARIRQALPDTAGAVFYRVESEGPYGQTRYGLRLPAEKIEFLPA